MPLQQAFKDIYYLILNEKSIIRQVYLAQIDCRLHQIYPMRNNNYFRGLNILLVGDFHQLPPVGQAALYSNLPARPSELASRGKGAYKAINRTAVLNQVMRQGGNNPKSTVFRTDLIELYSDSISNSTQKLLLTRCKQGLPTNKVAGFNNATRLYSTRAAIGKYNTTQLCYLLQPVVAIKLVNTGVGA